MSSQTDQPLTNWGGNYAYQAEKIVYPETLEELQDIVRGSQRVKGLGSRHSFSSIADTTGTLISFANFNHIIHLDEVRHTVTLEAGVTYGQLCPYLDERGFALPNLASLPHITVVGSCMTGTHGSGVKNGNLATSVTAIEFVAADGTVHHITQEDQTFSGMVVGLGAFGLITKMSLKIIPRFEMWQQVFLKLPYSTLLGQFDEIVSSAYSISLFTSWRATYIDQIWIKERAERPTFDSFFEANSATKAMHPIPDGDAQATTEQMARIGSWYKRLPHFRLGFQPSFGREIQSEYFIGLENAVEAIEAIHSVSSEFASHLLISELRTIAADDLWLSPAYKRASLAFHFTWQANLDAVRNSLPVIEEQLLRFEVRPHWGKVFTLDHDYVWSQYEHTSDFFKLVHQYDPAGKFSNSFLRNAQ
jgi:alditol oxidase